MMSRDDKKAQSMLEYAAIIACMVAALLAMQHYIRRGVQGKLREAADSIGEQYDPQAVSGRFNVGQVGTTEVVSRRVQEGEVIGIETETLTRENAETRKYGFEELSPFIED